MKKEKEKQKYCWWCNMHEGKKRKIIGKVYERDIKKVEEYMAMLYVGVAYFHKECLIKQLRHELLIEENDFERKRKTFEEEIEKIENE